MITAVFEQTEVPVMDNGDGTFSAMLLTPMVADGIGIHPSRMDVSKIVKDPSITVGMNGPRVGEILKLQEGDDGDLIAVFRFAETTNGKTTERLFTSGLLWSLQAVISVKKTVKSTREIVEKYGIPFDCDKIATSVSLDAIVVDAFAPF